MGGWIFPDMQKEVNLTSLAETTLFYYHDNLHILWRKLEEGYHFEWTFLEIYKLHHAVVKEMKKRGINHLVPINELDKAHFSADSKAVLAAYSVEVKMDGFPVTVHKKGKEVKIFSEEKEDITIAFSTIVKSIKELSGSDFIIDGELVPYNEKGKILKNDFSAKKSGFFTDDKNIKLYVWDMVYYNEPLDGLPLRRRIEFLRELKFNETVLEVERKIISDKERLKKAITLVSNSENSEEIVVKDLTATYSFGEDKSWKKYKWK